MPLRAETRKFPVFYPVTREQRAETGSLETASSGGESSANLASLIKEPLAGSGAHARDIAKNACFQLLLVEAVLHQITDTHDALLTG
jgi:hypothetical protein